MNTLSLRALALSGAAAALGLGLHAQAQQNNQLGYRDTPFLPGSKWRVHDADRPQPKVIDPGTASTQDRPGRPPADAVVLFDGKDLSGWKSEKGEPSGWKVQNGYMEVPARSTPGGGTIVSRHEFGDAQLHVEFATPSPGQGQGQGRGNSGVLVFNKYEIQVLDSYENQTYPDGQAGSIYGQYPPLVNASRKPGEWQTYDILYYAPRFKESGELDRPARFTVLHNGVLVQHNARVLGGMAHRVLPKYTAHPPKGPLAFQDHGNPVRYRNIWVRDLKGYDEK